MNSEQAKVLRSDPNWQEFVRVLHSDIESLKDELVSVTSEQEMIRVQEKIKVIRLVITRLDTLCDEEEE